MRKPSSSFVRTSRPRFTCSLSFLFRQRLRGDDHTPLTRMACYMYEMPLFEDCGLHCVVYMLALYKALIYALLLHCMPTKNIFSRADGGYCMGGILYTMNNVLSQTHGPSHPYDTGQGMGSRGERGDSNNEFQL